MRAADVTISHPDKVLFPDDGITKGELAEYYRQVAPVMLRHVRGRPLTLERYPSGIGSKGFMQKQASAYFPEWVRRVALPKKNGAVDYVVADNEATLVYLANQNCITPHVWMSRVDDPDRPDLLMVDLDPSGDDFTVVRESALLLKELLDSLGLPSWVKTTGSRGLHVVVPLDRRARFGDVAELAWELGRALVSRDPKRLTMEGLKAEREGRLYVDVGRNAWGAMAAAVYAVRARPGAPVSMPVTWDEVASGSFGPRRWTLRNALGRLEDVGDLWAGMSRHGRSLAPARSRLEKLER